MTAAGVVMGPAQSWATILMLFGLVAAGIAIAILRGTRKQTRAFTQMVRSDRAANDRAAVLSMHRMLDGLGICPERAPDPRPRGARELASDYARTTRCGRHVTDDPHRDVHLTPENHMFGPGVRRLGDIGPGESVQFTLPPTSDR